MRARCNFEDFYKPDECKLVLNDMDLQDDDIHALIEFLKKNPKITALDVANNNIGIEGAKALARNKTLKMLNVGSNNIRAEGAKALALNNTLTALHVNYNKIGDEGAKALALNKTLTTLDVGGNMIGNEGAKGLARNKTLKTLDVYHNNIGDEGAIALALNTTLTTLDVGNNNIGNEGAKGLARNTSLTTLIVPLNNIHANGAIALALNSTLKTLDMRYNNIGAEGAIAIALNTTLKTLDLRGNKIGDEGAKALALNTTLTALHVNKHNEISAYHKKKIQERIEINIILQSALPAIIFERALKENVNSPVSHLNHIPEVANFIYCLMHQVNNSPNITPETFSNKVQSIASDLRKSSEVRNIEVKNLSTEINNQINVYIERIKRENNKFSLFTSNTKIKLWEDKIAVLTVANSLLMDNSDPISLKDQEDLHAGWKDGTVAKTLVEKVKTLKGIPLDWNNYNPDQSKGQKK